MMLPKVSIPANRVRRRDLRFTGLDRRDAPEAGALEDCTNLSADRWPLLSPRKGRELVECRPGAEDFFRWDGRLALAAGETLYLDGEALGQVMPGGKQFCVVNSTLCVFPDKVTVDLRTGAFSRMDETLRIAGNVTVTDSSLSAPSDELIARDGAGTEKTGSASVSLPYNLLLYTYGRDREAVSACWHDGAWDGDALGALEQTAGLLSRDGADYLLDGNAAGGIFIPSETGGVPDYVLGNLQGGILTPPDRSAYNASGLYAVLTKPEKLEIRTVEEPFPAIQWDVQWRFDVYRAGAANPLFSGVLREGDAVDVSGTRYGFGDGEKLSVNGLREEDNTLLLPEGSLTAPRACCLPETALGREEACSLGYGGTWYRFSAGAGVSAGLVLYLLSGDETHVYVWDPEAKRQVKALSASPESSAGEGRTVLTAEAYDPASGAVTVQRSVPDLDYICQCGNRLWGVSNRQENRLWDPEKGAYVTYTTRCVYASALGEPAAFYQFRGLSTDSWQTCVGSQGDFTAMCPWDGGVACWKERELIRVSGAYPQEYRLSARSLEGPMAGSDRSLVHMGSALYYLSRSGVRVWSGGEPVLLSACLGGEGYARGVGGTDGRKYWLSALRGDRWELLAYDSRSRCWLREDDTRALRMGRSGSGAELLRPDGSLLRLDAGGDSDPGETETVAWDAVFARLREDPAEEKKRCLRLLLRVELSPGSTLTAAADTGGGWRVLQTLCCTGETPEERTVVIPVWPHRTDRLRLRVWGRGQAALLGLAREYVKASIYG